MAQAVAGWPCPRTSIRSRCLATCVAFKASRPPRCIDFIPRGFVVLARQPSWLSCKYDEPHHGMVKPREVFFGPSKPSKSPPGPPSAYTVTALSFLAESVEGQQTPQAQQPLGCRDSAQTATNPRQSERRPRISPERPATVRDGPSAGGLPRERERDREMQQLRNTAAQRK